MKLLLIILIAIVVCWLCGDFIYSRVVAYRRAQWERSIQRDDDGVREGCREYTLGEGQTAFLFVHGFNDSPAMFRKMAQALADEGFTCRAMRLPGFADPAERYARTTRAEWLAAVQDEVKTLRERHDRVFIIGHSLGGAITIAFVCENPDAVDGAVLIAPAVDVSNSRSPLLPVRWWHAILSRLLIFTRVVQSRQPVDAHDPAALDYQGRDPFIPRTVVGQVFQLLDENRDRAREFQVPLLMVLTKEDQVIDWQAAKQFYDDVASPDKRLRYMDNAGHAIPIDYGWEDLSQEIAEFAKQTHKQDFGGTEQVAEDRDQ